MRKTVGLFATVAVMAACVSLAEERDPEEVVASIDGVKYLRKDLDNVVNGYLASQNVPAAQRDDMRKLFERNMINHFINKTLLKLAAENEGVTVTDEDRQREEARAEATAKAQGKTFDQLLKMSPFGAEAARKEFEDGILVEKLMKMKIRDTLAIDDAEVEKVIGEMKERNAKIEEGNKNAEGGNAAQRKKLEGIKKQLEGGADFAELAKQHSDCPSAQQGGSLGMFKRGMMVKPFEDAAFAQEVGKVGEIVETQFGYHLILVTEKPADAPERVTASHILVKTHQNQPLQPIPTAEQIREHLKSQKMQGAVQAYLGELKAKAKIETVVPVE